MLSPVFPTAGCFMGKKMTANEYILMEAHLQCGSFVSPEMVLDKKMLCHR